MDPNSGKAEPQLLRTATVTVQKVLFSDSAIVLAQGDTAAVTLHGDGTDTGARRNGNASDRFNMIDGEWSVGETKILLLKADSIPYEDGDHPAVDLTQNRRAEWSINGETAESTIDGRSAPAGQLISRISAERQRGRVTETPDQAAATEINPVATGG